MKTQSHRVQLDIDGQESPPEAVHPLFQRDPFPGGHDYVVRVCGENAAAFLLKNSSITHCGSYNNLDRNTCVEVFQCLDWLVLAPMQREIKRHRYFLNSIHRLNVTSDEVSIEGVCSRVAE
jgi:hypothetical protein